LFKPKKLYAGYPTSRRMASYITGGDISFVKHLNNIWKEYPASLGNHRELDKLVYDVWRNFEDNKKHVLISDHDTSKESAVLIHDYHIAPDLSGVQSDVTNTIGQISTDNTGQEAPSLSEIQAFTTSHAGHSSTTSSEEEPSSVKPWDQPVIQDSETLRKRIKWPTPPGGKSLIQYFLERVQDDKENPTGFKKDPACRLV
jgi:hypothetical protein